MKHRLDDEELRARIEGRLVDTIDCGMGLVECGADAPLDILIGIATFMRDRLAKLILETGCSEDFAQQCAADFVDENAIEIRPSAPLRNRRVEIVKDRQGRVE